MSIEICDTLQRYLHEFNLRQKQVTEKIGIAVPQQWQKYEYKQMTPSAEIIAKLATTFNVSADYLLGLTDTPQPTPPKTADEELINAVVAYRTATKTFDKFLAERGIE